MGQVTKLFIDTSETEKITVAILIDGKRFERQSDSKVLKAQALLALIDNLLNEQDVTIHDITSITVNTGPGSFTGLRVGVSVANTLGFSLGLPVNGKTGTIVLPVYSREF